MRLKTALIVSLMASASWGQAIRDLPSITGPLVDADMGIVADAVSGTFKFTMADLSTYIGTLTSTDRIVVAQATHGFSVNQWVMHNDATNAWELLDSTAIDGDNHAVGFVAVVTDANNFTVSIAGSESWTHALDIGPLYASSTPGTLTDTTPVLGAVEWLVAVASSAGIVVIMQREWIQL